MNLKTMLTLAVPFVLGASLASATDPAPTRPVAKADANKAARSLSAMYGEDPDAVKEDPGAFYAARPKGWAPLTRSDLRPAKFTPRTAMPKIPTAQLVEPIDYSGRLVVKFRDEVKARSSFVQDGGVASEAQVDLTDVQAVLDAFGLQIRPVFTMKPADILKIETRASVLSNKGQPDLQGMMYVTAPGGVGMQAAQALNDLDVFEWVTPQKTPTISWGYAGPPDPACGEPATGPCDDSQNGSVFCDDLVCCEQVCAIDPFCCDEDMEVNWPGRGQGNWDAVCYWVYLQVCGIGSPPDICAGSQNDCFEAGVSPGCTINGCCQTVCGIDAFCCEVAWDEDCVQLAIENCPAAGAAGPTPNFYDAQGYMTSRSYIDEHGSVPANIADALPLDPNNALVPLPGWQGQGYRMDDLYALGDFLVGQGIGEQNLTRGKGRKVGVIEHRALVDHEELINKVIPEPGQTQIIFDPPEFDAGHGTATLGIIGAKDNQAQGGLQEKGIVGMQPEAGLYFFPIVSVEEGGRLLNAMLNAYGVFGEGDVLSYSIGLGNLPISSAPDTWALLRLGSDLGITSCISAGNSTTNIDNGGQFMATDSGCVIVGAVYPGRNDANSDPGIEHCRLGFSSYCRNCDGANQIHISAWGEAVTTLGYGFLYFGADGNGDPDPNRSYTNVFNGTSAAAPMAASLCSAMQGVAEMMYDTPLLPEQIRQVIGTGFPQCGPGFGTPPGSSGNLALGDYDPDSDANWVQVPGAAVMTNTVQAARDVIETPWFDGNPFIDDVYVLTGDKLLGSKFSIALADQVYFVVRSDYVGPNHPSPNGDPSQPFNGMPERLKRPTYVATGQIADILITANTLEEETLGLSARRLSYAAPTQTPTSAIQFLEMYNFVLDNWYIQGADVIAQSEAEMLTTGIIENEIFSANAYVREGDNLVAMRVWTLTLSFGFNANATVFHDLADVIPAQDIGFGNP